MPLEWNRIIRFFGWSSYCMTSQYQLALRPFFFSDRSGQESMFSRVSGQCGIGTRCQRRREAPIITVSWASPLRLVSTTARSAHYHGVSGFALAARALPSRLGLRRGCAGASPSWLGLRPRGLGFALAIRATRSRFALTVRASPSPQLNEFIYFVQMNS